jgi:hypothetical protein
MIDLRVEAVVTFRDADEPRPLSSRLVATAHRHADGWSLHVPDLGLRTGHATMDEAVAAVRKVTGIRHVVMTWTEIGPDRSAANCDG